MKRFLTLMLSLLLVFSLVACNSNDNPDPSGTNNNEDPLNRDPGTSQSGNQGGTEGGSANVGDMDFGSIMSGEGGTDVIWGKQDEATKQQIIAEAKKDGVDVSFGADGSMTVVDTDGTTVVQKPDGTWVMKDADGNEGQFGGNWPENDFTKLVPKPDLELFAASTDAEEFTVAFNNATIEQVREYVTKVKAAGFNLNEEVEDQEMMGMVIYSFYAESSSGYSVEIFFASGTTGMTITKMN